LLKKILSQVFAKFRFEISQGGDNAMKATLSVLFFQIMTVEKKLTIKKYQFIS
jgi:hypothetical protein